MDNVTDDVVKGILSKKDLHLGKTILKFTKENHDLIYQVNLATGDQETHGSVRTRSIRVAQEMSKRGVELDDLIIMCAINGGDTCLPLLSSLYLGAKVLCASVDMVYAEISHLLQMGTPKIIFCNKSIASTFHKAVSDLNIKTEIVVFDWNTGDDFIPFSEFLKPTGTEESFEPTEFDPATTTAFIVCSSGTTGLPKGICLSHKSILVQSYVPFYLQNMPKGLSFLIYSSMFWLTGIIGVVMPGIMGFTRLYVPSSFTPENLFSSVNKYKPNLLLLTPMTTATILSHPDIDTCDFSSINVLILLGSAVPPERIQAIQKKIPNGLVSNTYGITEMTGALTYVPKIKGSSCGRVHPWVKWKVVDPETGADLGPNQLGELICKSDYTQFLGYFNNPEDTAKIYDEDKWLHTGDLVTYDDEGFLYVIDRIKQMLKYHNYHVTPAELEDIILKIEGVEACCVVGIQHPIDGDRPMAFVQLAQGANVTEKQILDKVKENVSEQKQLREGVVFLEKFPVTHSNKIDRREINRIKMNYVKNKE